ncbi:TPA: hypothetical protein ACQ8V0_004420 [Escherichia coli]|uniref:hypothetical protein n=1 Tax=Escherichia coli TaxID=562 RepID=UPI001BB9F7F5|nr:hypothetical protein [Escherichia coli]EEZ9807539.1 hypothetical protein [Escherichia coli O25]EGM7964313.1 hypothetical protein [Escherichia coli]EHU6047699.1 hypothetical protein [Escherichia coli]EIV7460350.1 hypothetical protein [Escherichia coli]
MNNDVFQISPDEVTSELTSAKERFLRGIQPYVRNGGISNLADLHEVQQHASKYFNTAVKLVQKVDLCKLDDNKTFAISLAGDCRAVLETYLEYYDMMVANIKHLKIDPDNIVLYSKDGLSNIQRIIKKYSSKDIYTAIIAEFESRKLPIDGFTIGTPMNWKLIVTAIIGFLSFCIFLSITLLMPDLNEFQKKMISSLYFMSAAVGISPFIANNIKVNGKMVFRGSEFKVSAIGGLATLIVSFIIQAI